MISKVLQLLHGFDQKPEAHAHFRLKLANLLVNREKIECSEKYSEN